MSNNIFAIKEIIAAILSYMPKLLAGIGIYLLGTWLIDRIIKMVKKGLSHRNFDISLESFLLNLSSIGLKIFLIISVAEQLGIQTTLFVTILGAISLAIGLALQGTLANFAGGVLILVFRPFKVGDFIEAQGQAGTVTEIQIFNTVLLAMNSKTIIIPNGILSNGTIVNNTRTGTLLFELKIEVDRKSSLEKIRKLVLPIMGDDVRILKDPSPSVGISHFGNGYFILISGLTHPAEQPLVISSLYEKISQAFADHSIIGPITPSPIHNH